MDVKFFTEDGDGVAFEYVAQLRQLLGLRDGKSLVEAVKEHRAALERIRDIADKATLIVRSEGYNNGARRAGWRLENNDMRDLVDALAVLHG